MGADSGTGQIDMQHVFQNSPHSDSSMPFTTLNPLNAEVKGDTTRTVILLSGDFAGAGTCGGMLEMLEALILSGYRNMIVDHMDVAYTDTLAVGVLLYVLNSLEKNGGRLVLTGVNPQMKKIIYVSKLHTRLEIFDNLQDAETFAF